MSKRKAKIAGKGVKNLHALQVNAAGIDIGASSIYVAVPDDRDENCVRQFDTFTDNLHDMANWLKKCQIESIAMESTGVYWIPVFQILAAYNFDVILVNARHIKNVPGRKTDVQDCQWIQYLHSVGLLRGSFRPDQDICAVRSLLRHRDNLVKASASYVQLMQKSLTQMNLQLHNVISDITGVTGLAIIESILNGERDPQKLAELRNYRIKADKNTIAKSLTGDYRPEHIFTLRQTLQTYKTCRQLISECDIEIEKYLNEFESKIEFEKTSDIKKKKTKKPAGNGLNFDLRSHMHRLLGTDLTLIDGIDALTAHIFFTEVGPDLSSFKNENHFCSWLCLCPHNKISGGKILSSKTQKNSNRLATALRISANALSRSKSYLGEYCRRMKARHGAPKAITATAHKLARIIFHLVKNQKAFDETVFADQEKQHQERLRNRVLRQAKSLGFELVPA